MPNFRILADNMKDQYSKGMPDGIDERYIREAIPVLFRRIEELQNALKPFAKVGLAEKGVNKELVTVYHADCDAACNVMAYENSIQPKKEEYWPAE